MAELADALRSGRSGLQARVSSNLTFGTTCALVAQWIERCPAEAEVGGSNPPERAIDLSETNLETYGLFSKVLSISQTTQLTKSGVILEIA